MSALVIVVVLAILGLFTNWLVALLALACLGYVAPVLIAARRGHFKAATICLAALTGAPLMTIPVKSEGATLVASFLAWAITLGYATALRRRITGTSTQGAADA